MEHFLSFLTWYFSQNLISSCKQSACPCEVDVSILFHPQGPWWAHNTQGNRYRLCKVTTGWWIPAEAWKIVWEYQESIPKSASSRNCKWNVFWLSVIFDLLFIIGAMGPGEVRATCHGMGHHMWPAIQRSAKAWIRHDDELYTSLQHFNKDSKTQWHQAASDEDGRRYYW